MTGENVTSLPFTSTAKSGRGFELGGLYLTSDKSLAVPRYAIEGQGNLLRIWDVTAKTVVLSQETDLEPLGFTANGATLLTYSKEGVALRDPRTLVMQKLLVSGAIKTLHLDAVPTLVDVQTYTVGGTVTFGDAPPVPLTGEVSGGDLQRYSRMSSIPVLETSIRLESESGNVEWHFEGWPIDRDISWTGFLAPTEGVPNYEIKLAPTGQP